MSQLTSVSFDAVLRDVFLPLTGGATLCLPDRRLDSASARVLSWLNAEGVTVVHTVPTLAATWLKDWDSGSRLERLRYVFFSGEALPAKLVRDWRARVGGEVVNLYGPTETTMTKSYYVVPAEVCDGVQPLGVPMPQSQLLVLSEENEQCHIGEVGEIAIRTPYRTKGYVNAPAEERKRFVKNPFLDDEDDVLYLTGDVGRYGSSGQLEWLGRNDEQLKIRGVRVEPVEVEEVLRSHAGVRGAVVVGRPLGDGELGLVGYVLPDKGASVRTDELREYTRKRLPGSIVPSVFVWLEKFPLLPSGKVDRGALPEPELAAREGVLYEAPRTPQQEELARIWSDLLHVERVGVRDNFFELGGHSLLAVRMMSRIGKAFGVELAVRALFEAPTVRELSRVLDERREEGAGTALAELARVDRMDRLPLSYSQQRLWFLDKLDSELAAYNMCSGYELRGELDVRAFERALCEVVRRHEVLRTRFETRDGRAEQIIEPAQDWCVEMLELDCSRAERPTRLEELLHTESEWRFDLARGGLFRAVLVRMDEEEHVLMVSMHHIISDGWSEGVLYRELGCLYAAFAREEPSPLPVLPIQYADYAVWQRAWLEGAVLESHLEYWREELRGMQPLELATDRPRPTRPSRRGGSHRFELSESSTRTLKRLSSESGATLFMTLFACVVTFLYRYSRQEDIIVGPPIANRNREETEGLIGFFVNMLPLRITLEDDTSFRELLRRSREKVLDALAHQDLPFEKLVEEISPERDPSHHPIFQVTFALEHATDEDLALPGIDVKPYARETRQVNFDLEIYFRDAGDRLRCDFVYSRDLFDTPTIHRMVRNFELLLDGVAANADVPLRGLPTWTPSELHQVSLEWNDTEVAFPSGLLHAMFESQVEHTPHAIALVFEEETLTYCELNRRANRLAHRLLSHGAGPETLVGICLDSSPDVVVSFLAVLKAGGAYVPLEPGYPAKRLELVVKDSQVALLLTTAELASRFEQWIPRIICLDSDWDRREEGGESNPTSTVAAENPAYVLFTSGSTGRPKGVVVTHRAITNHMHWMQSALPLHEEDRVLQKTPVWFDASVWEFWAPLLVGAQLVLTSSHGKRDPAYLVQKMRQHGATILQVVPTLLELLLEGNELAACRSLRRVLCGGERLKLETVERFFSLDLEASLYNVYGPTEATIHASSAKCERAQTGGDVPIGRPIDNARVLILDRDVERVPLGAPGELYITGVGLARGYLNQPGWTAKSFIPNPFSTVPGARMYRTGDRARYRPDGQLEFLGRFDDQVKVRGHRIKLGDVEAALIRHESVEQCAVTVHRSDRDDRIVAYFVLRTHGNEQPEPPSPRELRAFLSELLPEVMLPSSFFAINALPLTSSGKIDRGALPAPDGLGAEDEHGYRPPGNPVEESIASIWEELLSIDRVGARDNFFELGGHSLLAVRVISRIAKVLGVALPVRALFESPTVFELSREVKSATGAPGPELERVERAGRLPLSYSQRRLWFLDELGAGPAYNICSAFRLEGDVDTGALERALCEVVRRHEVLRTRFESRDGEAEQVVEPARDWRLVVLEPEGERSLTKVLREENARRFELQRGGLFRAVLMRLAEKEHVLILNVHHIVSDGWSQGIITRELTSLYEAYRRGHESPLPELPIQYVDYAVWQRKSLEGDAVDSQLAYWREQLSGVTPLELPTDRPRPAVQSYRGDTESFRLSAALTSTMRDIGRDEGATLFMTLLAAVNALLSRYSGQDDVVVGSVVAGRNHSDLESMVGIFLNLLTLRTDLSGDPTFRKLVQRTKHGALSAMAHQDLPFEKLVEELQVERDLSRAPLFQMLFILHNTPGAELALDGLMVSRVAHEAVFTPYDLVLDCTETADGLVGALTYNTDLFEAKTIRRMLTHFEVLLERVAAAPGHPLSSINFLSPAEQHQMSMEGNDTHRDYPRERCIQALFEEKAERTPDTSYAAPHTAVNATLIDIWQNVLGVERVGVHDNFFDLGGHSLLALRVISRITKQLGVQLPVRALFEGPTVAQLSRAVQSGVRAPIPELERVERAGRLPLSYSQQRLWFLDALESGSAYNMCSAFRLEGELDARALERALREVVRRHEVLRTRFVNHDGESEQVVESSHRWRLDVLELEGPRAQRQKRLEEVLHEESAQRLELARGGLFRATLLRVEADEHILVLTVHHIVSDGWSQGVIKHELTTLYEAYQRGEVSPLAELSIQYVDYALWQRKCLEDEVMERELAHWREQLHGLTPLELPTDRPRPAVQTYRGREEPFRLTLDLTRAAKELGGSEGATLFMTLLTAFSALLSRYSGQDDIAVGTVVAGRSDPALEGMVGLFLNVLTLRTVLSGDPSFRELLRQSKDVTLSAMAHQDLPFEKLVEELQITRDLSRSPLFQVLFILQNMPERELALGGLNVSRVRRQAVSAPYDLVLDCTETEEGLAGSLTYNTDLFDATTMRRMLTHFENLIESVVAEPERPLSGVHFLSPAERHQMLWEWNDTEVTESAELCFHDVFETMVERAPDALAATCDGYGLSYGELNQRANRLAHRLVERGIVPNVVVGLLAHRGLDCLTAMLAVLKAGGVYMPLDPSYPVARLAHAVRQSGSRCLLFVDDTRGIVAETVALIDKDQGIDTLQLEGAIHTGASEDNLRARSSPDDLAYVIFTSGSSGVAKGAMVTHKGMFNHLLAKISDLELTDADVVAQTAPQSFDISVWQFLAILLMGGRVEIVDDESVRDPELLLERVFKTDVSILEVVPSFLAAVLDSIDNARQSRRQLARLRWMIPTGEALPPELARRWLRDHPKIPLLNAYGPTECSDDVTHHRIHLAPEDDVTDMPIGRPLRNTRIYVLDKALQPVPIGCRGEICVGSTPVGRGYVNDASRTAVSFVPDPFASAGGGRLYRTGDEGRFLADGTLEYLGRIDNQVKLRGYRIELGEVEVALRKHPQVAEAVVVARGEVPSEKRLVAYVVGAIEAGDAALTPEELGGFLAATLPLYMVPSAFVFLDTLPLNRNGKIDRGALPMPETLGSGGDLAYQRPSSTTEKALAAIWAELLDSDQIGCSDDFFALGGQSLIAVRMMVRIQRSFGVKLPLAAVFRQSTLGGLAALIDERPQHDASIVVPIQTKGERTPLFCVHPAGGHVLCYSELARDLGAARPFYGLQVREGNGVEPYADLVTMASDYLEAIQKIQARGPYLLAGWSMGAVVAHNVACQLESHGETVATLVLLDPPELDSGSARSAASLEAFAKQFGVSLARSDSNLVTETLEDILRQGQRDGTVSSHMNATSFQSLYDIFQNNIRILNAFTPKPSS